MSLEFCWCRLWHDDLWIEFIDGGGIKDGWTPVSKKKREQKLAPIGYAYTYTHQTTQIIVSWDH